MSVIKIVYEVNGGVNTNTMYIAGADRAEMDGNRDVIIKIGAEEITLRLDHNRIRHVERVATAIYVLTDGSLVYATRIMDEDEAKRENRREKAEKSGRWWFVLPKGPA